MHPTHDLSIAWLPYTLLALCFLVVMVTLVFNRNGCPQEDKPTTQPLQETTALFRKTRIFLTVSEKEDIGHGRGECYSLDLDGLLPFQAGQSLSLRTPDNTFFYKITSIIWLPEHNCMGVYTDTVECKESECANLCYTVEALGFKAIKL